MHNLGIRLLLLFLLAGISVNGQETRCIYHISFGNLQCDYGYDYDTIPYYDSEGFYTYDSVMYSLGCRPLSNWNIITLNDSLLSKQFHVTSCDRSKSYTVLDVVFRLKNCSSNKKQEININQGVFDPITIAEIKKYFSRSSGEFVISILDSEKKIPIPLSNIVFMPPSNDSYYQLSFYQWQWNSYHGRDTVRVYDDKGYETSDTVMESTGTDRDTFEFHCGAKSLFDTVHLVVTSADGSVKYEVKEFTIIYIRPYSDEINIECKGAYLTSTAKSIFEDCVPNDVIFLNGIEIADTNAPYFARLYGAEIECVK